MLKTHELCMMFMVLDVSHVLLFMHDQHNGHCLACLLNQALAGHRPARAWFLEITSVRKVSMCVCVCPPPGYE